MLKNTLKIHDDVDISKYAKVMSFMKRYSEGYKSIKAKVFSEDEIRKFLFEAPDIQWLAVKVSNMMRNKMIECTIATNGLTKLFRYFVGRLLAFSVFPEHVGPTNCRIFV